MPGQKMDILRYDSLTNTFHDVVKEEHGFPLDQEYFFQLNCFVSPRKVSRLKQEI